MSTLRGPSQLANLQGSLFVPTSNFTCGVDGRTSLTRVEDGRIYLIWACGLKTPSFPIPGVGLGGLMPRTEHNAPGRLPLTVAGFCGFCTHGPRVRLDELPTPSKRFVACVSASTATVDSSPGRGGGSLKADYDFA